MSTEGVSRDRYRWWAWWSVIWQSLDYNSFVERSLVALLLARKLRYSGRGGNGRESATCLLQINLRYQMAFKRIREFIMDEAGQSVVEYSLLLTMIGASAVFMVTMMGISVGRVIGISTNTVEHYNELSVDYSGNN